MGGKEVKGTYYVILPPWQRGKPLSDEEREKLLELTEKGEEE